MYLLFDFLAIPLIDDKEFIFFIFDFESGGGSVVLSSEDVSSLGENLFSVIFP
jgi:hypothetical protein